MPGLSDSLAVFSYCVCEGYPCSDHESVCIFVANFCGSVVCNFCSLIYWIRTLKKKKRKKEELLTFFFFFSVEGPQSNVIILAPITSHPIHNIVFSHQNEQSKRTRSAWCSKEERVMATWQCTVCDSPCEDEEHTERSIECFVCKKWAHQACTEITDDMFDNLTKAPNTQWVCRPCLENKGESRDERKLDKLLSMIPLMESLAWRSWKRF